MSQENEANQEAAVIWVPGRGAAPPFFRLTRPPRTRPNSTKGDTPKAVPRAGRCCFPSIRSAQGARSNNDVV